MEELGASELELELVQSHMAQKPILRGEVGARVRVNHEPKFTLWNTGGGESNLIVKVKKCDTRVRSETREEVRAGAVVQGARMSGCWCEVVVVLPRGGCVRHRVTPENAEAEP